MKITERPVIAGVTPKRDGYTARALCLVDGLPAQVHISIDTEMPKYSDYRIDVWDAVRQTWTHSIYSLTHDEVGHIPPLLVAETEAMAMLNTAAELMWHAANAIMQTGRLRQEEIDRNVFVQENLALDAARTTVEVREIDHGDFAENGAEPVVLASDAQLAELRAKLAGDE